MDGLSDQTRATLASLGTLGSPPSPRQLRDAAKELRSLDPSEGHARSAKVLDFLALTLELDEEPIPSVRDRSMADNILWIQREYLPGAKVLFWGHNGHVATLRRSGKDYMTGAHLKTSIGPRYRSVGFVFGEGAFRAVDAEDGRLKTFTVSAPKPGSLDASFRETGIPVFFLDVAALDAETRKWLSATRPVRGVGAGYDARFPDRYYEDLPMGMLYDGLAFVDKLSAANAMGR